MLWCCFRCCGLEHYPVNTHETVKCTCVLVDSFLRMLWAKPLWFPWKLCMEQYYIHSIGLIVCLHCLGCGISNATAKLRCRPIQALFGMPLRVKAQPFWGSPSFGNKLRTFQSYKCISTSLIPLLGLCKQGAYFSNGQSSSTFRKLNLWCWRQKCSARVIVISEMAFPPR